MKSIDTLLEQLRMVNSPTYDRINTIARVVFEEAGTDYKHRYPFPRANSFSQSSAYSLAVSNWYSDMNECQIKAFFGVLRESTRNERGVL